MGAAFFVEWPLWVKMTFVLACAIIVTVAVASLKVVWARGRLRTYTAIAVADKQRLEEVRASRNVIYLGGQYVPFGVRAIESGIEVDGVWISRPNSPAPSIRASRSQSPQGIPSPRESLGPAKSKLNLTLLPVSNPSYDGAMYTVDKTALALNPAADQVKPSSTTTSLVTPAMGPHHDTSSVQRGHALQEREEVAHRLTERTRDFKAYNLDGPANSRKRRQDGSSSYSATSSLTTPILTRSEVYGTGRISDITTMNTTERVSEDRPVIWSRSSHTMAGDILPRESRDSRNKHSSLPSRGEPAAKTDRLVQRARTSSSEDLAEASRLIHQSSPRLDNDVIPYHVPDESRPPSSHIDKSSRGSYATRAALAEAAQASEPLLVGPTQEEPRTTTPALQPGDQNRHVRSSYAIRRINSGFEVLPAGTFNLVAGSDLRSTKRSEDAAIDLEAQARMGQKQKRLQKRSRPTSSAS